MADTSLLRSIPGDGQLHLLSGGGPPDDTKCANCGIVVYQLREEPVKSILFDVMQRFVRSRAAWEAAPDKCVKP
jgi:hypothetical protein